jgi:molybdenum cofactor cytidylyltransferase
VNVGAVVLAAGGSSRLGRPKQLLQFRGQSLVRVAVEAAIGAECAPIVVVLGAESERIKLELIGRQILFVPNDDWRRGIGSSIRAGVKALEFCDAIAILACDQPHVTADLIGSLIRIQEETHQPIVASAYAETLGVPALFAQSCIEKLLSLGDKSGAKSILQAQPNDVAQVAFPEGAIDIDSATDYERLNRSEDQRGSQLDRNRASNPN